MAEKHVWAHRPLWARGQRFADGWCLYFIGFEYQPTGVLVNGKHYPIVSMDWVEGDTLGSFLEDNYSDKGYSDKGRIECLRSQFAEVERFLRSKGLAHGDLQRN
ncbi:hypothetical protein ACUSIJ_17960 [Pseudochelatococcus sp. B33]